MSDSRSQTDNKNQKFIFVNNVMTLNPNYVPPAGTAQIATTTNPNAMAIVSNFNDMQALPAGIAQLPVPTPFQQALNTIQDDKYVAGFQSKDVDGGSLMDGLMTIFGQNEIPIGLMSKLTALQGATLHFKVDDSGSMDLPSSVKPVDACAYTKANMSAGRLGDPRRPFLSRWEEAEDRLHTLIELLAYVPTGPIIFSFFDHPNLQGTGIDQGAGINLNRAGKAPLQFLDEAHKLIHDLFLSHRPRGGTPTLLNMINMLNTANQMRGNSMTMTMHYMLTDGEPDRGNIEIMDIKNFLTGVTHNRNAALHPFTFLACTNDEEDYEWMHEIEEVAVGKYVAAINDFRDEKEEIKKDQGIFFPYSRGFWLLANVVAAINPNDLDALDQHAPLTKPTIEGLVGRGMTPEEYRRYWTLHPTFLNQRDPVFEPDYQQFLTAGFAINIPSVQVFDTTLAQILSKDINSGEDETEARAEKQAEDSVRQWRRKYGSRAPQFVGSMYGNAGGNYGSSASGQNPPRYNP